ncbi:unnamed protein product [Soboliphyme baturini]|uniref:Uncharacterized protein n=1 Tax=Soboliphyme baturini TaxID=241478 RepID=A0A183IT44_9BILA|nr:unnamed protein product [Soboliphyme baturini]
MGSLAPVTTNYTEDRREADAVKCEAKADERTVRHCRNSSARFEMEAIISRRLPSIILTNMSDPALPFLQQSFAFKDHRPSVRKSCMNFKASWPWHWVVATNDDDGDEPSPPPVSRR